MPILRGIVWLTLGAIFLFLAPRIGRRQGFGALVCIVLAGLFLCSFATLDLAEGFGHSLFTPDARLFLFIGFFVIVLPSGLFIRRPKKNG